jgi:hypothetical protein
MSAFLTSPPELLVVGAQTVSDDVFARIGTITADVGKGELVATIATSDPLIPAELQLLDTTTGLPVAGSQLKTVSVEGETLTSLPFALPSSGLYNLELRAQVLGARATCTAAQLSGLS